MTDDELTAIETRARAPKVTFNGAPAIFHEDADTLALIAEVRRLRLTLAGIAGLGGPAGEVAGQALWTDQQREEWARLRRAQRKAARESNTMT